MKLIAIITVKVKQNYLSELIEHTSKHGCGINSILITETEKKWEQYSIEIYYNNRKNLRTLIEMLSEKNDRFRNIEMTSTLEENLRGGQLVIKGKQEIETVNDLKTKIISGNKIIHEKIDSDEIKEYSGIFNTVATISGFNRNLENSELAIHHSYADSERDSVIINKFTGLNSVPLTIKYSLIEDFFKTVRSIEHNYICIRILELKDFDFFGSNIIDNFNTAVISKENDELPVLFLSLIRKITRTFKLKQDQTSIGIVGLSISTIKLTRLINKFGYMKVLGLDNDENAMLNFEREKGLATTAENILMNTDIVLLLNDTFTPEMIQYLRPGQIVIISNSITNIKEEDLKDRGIKELIKFDESDSTQLLPGMLNGLIKSNFNRYEDSKLLKISEAVSKILSENYELPDFFSNIHDKISNFIIKA